MDTDDTDVWTTGRAEEPKETTAISFLLGLDGANRGFVLLARNKMFPGQQLNYLARIRQAGQYWMSRFGMQ